jgi:uncharacterized heparinase superfamily protein
MPAGISLKIQKYELGFVSWALSTQSLYDKNEFNFLNVKKRLITPALINGVSKAGACSILSFEHSNLSISSWDASGVDKLWLYNLHYFDDLNALDSKSRFEWHKHLIDAWILENSSIDGIGWESYPLSLRIVNWIKWFLTGGGLNADGIKSLSNQCRYLSKRVEWHLLGNHLFSNAKALVFAGLFFEGGEAKLWLTKGLQIIAQELPEQILPDGGNFERSPMYHAIFLKDLLDLINITIAFPGNIPVKDILFWRNKASGMLGWLEGMTHQDGQFALFNDAAFGISPELSDLKDYSARLAIHSSQYASIAMDSSNQITLMYWKDSGYMRLSSNEATAFLDVAPIGPDYIPGHAHADTLSFELSIFGSRVIVNGGTSCYGKNLQRLRERQTFSHSTVEVDGKSSSEVWGSFRVARRAYPINLETQCRLGSILVRCSHDGYSHLPNSPIHKRQWQMKGKKFIIDDEVIEGNYQSIARFIFHPKIQVLPIDNFTWRLKFPDARAAIFSVLTGEGRLELAQYAPEFGKVLSTQCLSVLLVGGKSQCQLSWK